MTSPLAARVIAQGRSLVRAIGGIAETELAGSIERFLSGLPLAAYRRRALR